MSKTKNESLTPVEELKALMTEHKLTRQKLADVLGVSIDAVDSWLRPPAAPAFRAMPVRWIRILKAMVKVNGGFGDAPKA